MKDERFNSAVPYVSPVISTRAFSGMNRNGLGMRINRSMLPQKLRVSRLGFLENSGTFPLPPLMASMLCKFTGILGVCG
jgi:hypothetical protein